MAKIDDLIEEFQANPTAKPSEMAKTHGVSAATVYRAKKIARNLDAKPTPAKEVKHIERVSIPEVINNKVVVDAHYRTLNVEPWDIVDGWPLEQQIGYHRGNAIKYLMRMGTKESESLDKEIAKAKAYVLKLLEVFNKYEEA